VPRIDCGVHMKIMTPTGDLTARITKEKVKGKTIFVAWNPEFDITSQGYTEEEAVKNLKDAIVGIMDVSKEAEIPEIHSITFFHLENNVNKNGKTTDPVRA